MTRQLFPLVIIAVVLFVILNLSAGLIWVERRLLALWQDRYGPNRVGPFGLGQVIADSVKMFKKTGFPRSPTSPSLSLRLPLLWRLR
jgi:NADH-quinone oxidoreductase subunit H